MAGYTRQSVADIVDGEDIIAAPLNNEFNAIQAAMHATTGHAHDGSSGNGPKLVLTAAAAVSGILPLANGGTGVALVDPNADKIMFWDDSAGAVAFLALPAAGITTSTTNLALANDLSALEGLSSTGIAVRSASDTWVQRTITGTSAEITVTDGDGVSVNPTISLPSALTFTDKTITGGTYVSPSFSGATHTYTYTDNGAAEGPVLILDRVTASPATSDLLGAVQFKGRVDGGGTTIVFGEIYATMTDPSGNADGSLTFKIASNAARTTRLVLNEAGATVSGTLTASGGGSLTGTWSNLGTVTTIDINGGTIDGTTIGSSSAADGTFTNVTLVSTDAAGSAGPTLDLFRNSASPAASDQLGYIRFSGNDSAGNLTIYSDMFPTINDTTNGSEDATLALRTIVAGTVTQRVSLHSTGVTLSGAIAGDSVTSTWVATQAEQETGTATDKIVTPGRQHFHQSAAKAWVRFNASTGTPTLGSSYNITSLTDGGVGITTVNIATDLSSAANNIPIVSAGNSGSRQNADLGDTSGVAAGTFNVATATDAGVLTDCSVVTGVVFGDI